MFGFQQKRRQVPAKRQIGNVILRGEWTGDIWDVRPVRVPAALDVGAFLEQDPLPSIWPNDPDFNEAMGEPATMRRLWIMVFLHHPDREVVVQCLRSPYLDNTPFHAVPVADLLVDSDVRQECAEAVWRLDDSGVHIVLNVVLDRAIMPSGHNPYLSGQALDLLHETCPAHRRDFLAKNVHRESRY